MKPLPSVRTLSFGLALAAASPGFPASDGPEPEKTPVLVDVTAESGLDFRHFMGESGLRYIVEVTGSGVAFLDYDGDGDLDAYLLNGAPFPSTPPPPTPHRNQLYRNEGGRFVDVTEEAGVGDQGFAMGLAVGDVDNDGDPDILVTNYGPDVFYRNRGNGTFEDVTDQVGLGDPGWTTSATFFDADNDGDLDLYVAGYVEFNLADFQPCVLRGISTTCGPEMYDPIADRLYRNDGTGRFEDVSRQAGVGVERGKGLGVVAGDYDNDGDQDLYVANDATANFLLINQHDQGQFRFQDEAIFYGAAFGENAKAEAGMGTDMGDFDEDGDLDVICTNLEAQTNSLYRNENGVAAAESSYAVGFGVSTLPFVGFGVRFLDYDLDADLDVMVTNGHVLENIEEVHQGSQFAQPNLLFDNHDGRFTEVLRRRLPPRVGRGLATGDFDNDGDVDVVINNVSDVPWLLRNDTPRKGGVVGLRLQGEPPGSNRDAYGARVTWKAFGKTRLREVQAGGSFCSSSDPRLLLAVPGDERPTTVSIRWPSGATESHDLAPGAYHHVVEGQGVVGSDPFHSPSP